MAVEFSDSITVANSLARMGGGGGLTTTIGAGGGGSNKGRRSGRSQFMERLVPPSPAAIGGADALLFGVSVSWTVDGATCSSVLPAGLALLETGVTPQ